MDGYRRGRLCWLPCADYRFCTKPCGYWSAAVSLVYPLLTGLRWLVTTRASFSGGLWTRQLSARCPAQHAVEHYIDGEAKPFVDISSNQATVPAQDGTRSDQPVRRVRDLAHPAL